MNLKFNSKGREGFTLVELLVTILIIVILSVTMLPLLKPFVTQAQYSAEGVPVIGNIRTKVELFRIEKDYLPGVPVNATTGKIIPVAGKTYATSYFNNTANAVPSDINAVSNGVQYLSVQVSGNTASEKFYVDGTELTSAGNLGNHVWKNTDIGYSDLTGKKLRPEHLQYIVFESDGDHYYWVVACFGDGNGLAKGCGYAVAEYNFPAQNRKLVATFELYKPKSTTQLKFVPANAVGTISLNNGEVFIPTAAALDTAASYETAVKNMRAYGWQVN